MSKTGKLKVMIEQEKIYVCGYCDEVIPEKTVIRHMKRIHNVHQAFVDRVITKVVML